MEEVAFNPTIEPPEVTQDWGNRPGPRRAQTKPVHTRTQEKGAVTPQETDPDLPVRVQESLLDTWVDSGLLQAQGHRIQHSWELWEVQA